MQPTPDIRPSSVVRRRRTVLAILGLAFVFRVVAFAANYPFPPLAKDDAVYDKLAWNLVEGNGFSASVTPPFEPMAVRTPGYPSFVAGVYAVAGRSPTAVRLAQIALSIVTCSLVFLVARRLAGTEAALIAAGLYAVFPAAVLYPSLVLTEANTALLLILALYCAARCMDRPSGTVWYIGCAVALAAATMFRPDYQLLALPVFGFLVIRAGFRKAVMFRAAAATALFVALLAPWAIRNYAVFGRFIGLATGTGHTAMTAKFEAEGKSGPALQQAFEDRYGKQFQEKYGRKMEYLDGARPAEDELRRRDVAEFIRTEPGVYTRQSFNRLTILWGPRSWSEVLGLTSDFSEYSSRQQYWQLAIKTALLMVDTLVLALAALGLLYAAWDWKRFGLFFVFVAYVSMIYALVYSNARYRVPVLPLVAILAGYAVSSATVRLRRSVSEDVPCVA